MYFKCLFRRSWGSEIKSNYKFNGNKFALFHSYLVFTHRPPPPAGSWKQVTREIKRYFIAIEYIVKFHFVYFFRERSCHDTPIIPRSFECSRIERHGLESGKANISLISLSKERQVRKGWVHWWLKIHA